MKAYYLILMFLGMPPALASSPQSVEFHDKMINITHGWEFFPEEIVSPKSPQNSEIVYPINVKFSAIPEMNHNPNGYATYRKVLDVGDYRDSITFKFPYCLQSCRFFINGQLVHSIGKISSKPNYPADRAGFSLINYTPQSSKLVLLVQASSYGKSYGGLLRNFTVGNQEAFRVWAAKNIGFDIALISACILMGFYHLVLYFLRPSNRSTLLFSLVCIFSGIRSTTANPSQLFLQNFEVPVSWAFRQEYILFYLAFVAIALFARELFKDDLSVKISKTTLLVFIPLSLFSLVAPLPMVSSALAIGQLSAISIFLGFLWGLSKSIKNKRSGIVLFLVGFLLFCSGSIYDIVMISVHKKLTNFSIIGLYSFLFVQASILALRFNQAFIKIEEDEEVISKLNKELENHIVNLDQTVKDRTKDIRNLMEHTPAGICVINKDLSFGTNYSRHLLEILHIKSLSNLQLPDILSQSPLGIDRIDQIKQTMDITIGEDLINFEANENFLPKELEITHGDGISTISINWNPIIEEDEVKEILLTLNDITEMRAAEIKNQQQQKELASINTLLSIGQKKFSIFVETARHSIQNLQRMLTGESPDFKSLFVILHTVKGNARTLKLTELTDELHYCEDHIQDAMKRKTTFKKSSIEEPLQYVMSTIDDLEKLALERLKWDQHLVSQFQINKSDIEQVQKLGLQILQEVPSPTSKKLVAKLNSFSLTLAKEIFAEIFHQADTIARDIGKPSPILDIQVPEVWFSEAQEKVLKDIFIHLLRNSLDHGIESEEERLAKGKSRQGTLSLLATLENGCIILDFKDDGRGLDLASLAQKHGQEGLEDEEIAETIFQSGLSTAQRVSQISGRGVGMDAVRQYAREIGGEVHVVLNEQGGNPRPFTLRIRFPLQATAMATAS